MWVNGLCFDYVAQWGRDCFQSFLDEFEYTP